MTPFRPTVDVVALLVAAKRYRCGIDAAYASGLSHASQLSLAMQGGAHSPSECERFQQRPFAADAVRRRGWDDAGKVEDLLVPDLDHFLSAIERVCVDRD